MSVENRCFCDLYRECQADPNKRVSVGYDAVGEREIFKSGEELIEAADRICPGTTVFIASQALSAADVTIGEDVVTMPRAAVNLQCEYFVAANPGM